MKLPRDSLRFLLLEGVIVVLSVLLALFLEDWRQQRDLDARAEVAVEQITAEIRLNRAEIRELAEIVATRRTRLETVLASRIDGETPFADLVSELGGYRTPDLSRATWDRVNVSDFADRIPEDLRTDAFFAYAWAGQFDALTEKITDLVYSPLFFDPDQARVAGLISGRIMEQQLIWAGPWRSCTMSSSPNTGADPDRWPRGP